MKKKSPLTWPFHLTLSDVEKLKRELENFNSREVNRFIAKADLLRGISGDLSRETNSDHKKDLGDTIKKLDRMRRNLFRIGKMNLIEQYSIAQTEGTMAAEIMEINFSLPDHIFAVDREMVKLINKLLTVHSSLKTKNGRYQVDRSGFIEAVSKIYNQHIERPRPEGGHFKKVISILLWDERERDTTRAIRAAIKKLTKPS